MSLSKKQEDDTRRELRENLARSGVDIAQAAADLGTTREYLERVMRLDERRLEDAWILRNYLIEKVREAGGTPTPFTALAADHHIIPFLNSAYIDGKKIY